MVELNSNIKNEEGIFRIIPRQFLKTEEPVYFTYEQHTHIDEIFLIYLSVQYTVELVGMSGDWEIPELVRLRSF